jgi:hypothetical protein
MNWWEENRKRDLKVGDLVRYRNGNKKPRTFLVLRVTPESTCKVNTVQYVKVVRNDDGRRFTYNSKDLTTNLDCQIESFYESR